MPLNNDDKDEIRELIATEMKKAVKESVNAVLNMPNTEGRYPTSESMEAREARNKLVREIGDAIVKSFEAVEREAKARVVEKDDPARAEIIRKLVPEW